MKHSARLIAAVLGAQALVATGVATAAYAIPSHGQHSTTAGHTHGHAGVAKELRTLAHLGRGLTRATSEARVGRLTDTDSAALLANAAVDEAAVETVAADLTADASAANLAAAAAVISTYRPQVYVRAVNLLRHSERLTAEITGLQPSVVADSPEAAALTSAVTLLAGVPASGFTATTSASTLRTDQRATAQAQALVGQVADALAGV